jgi:thymidine kinase
VDNLKKEIEYCSLCSSYATEIVNCVNDSKADPEIKKICVGIIEIYSKERDKNVTNFKEACSAYL